MFQKAVNTFPAAGLDGQAVSSQQYYTAHNFVSDGTCKAGAFAFAKLDADAKEGTDPFPEVGYSVATATITSGDGLLLGIVERDLSGTIPCVTEGASVVYTEGAGLNIIARGSVYATAAADCKSGQKVLVNPKDGKITYADTVGSDGAVDSGFVVTMQGGTSAKQGDIVIYQSFTPTAVKVA